MVSMLTPLTLSYSCLLALETATCLERYCTGAMCPSEFRSSGSSKREDCAEKVRGSCGNARISIERNPFSK